MSKKIEIKHLTFVINLKINFVMNYLKFIDELKEIKKIDTTDCLSSSKLDREYLILYIKPIPGENIVINKIVKSLLNNKIKCIAIDELFSNNNDFILKNKKIPSTSKWVTNKSFESNESYIQVQ